MAKKNKGPRVRHAKPGDRNLFRKLWKDYLTEAYENKELEYIPSEYTLDRFSTFFDAYVNKRTDGLVLFVGESSVLLAGAMSLIFEENSELKAVCWGVYVAPNFRRKGYFTMLTKEGKRLLKEMNFDTVVSGEVKLGSVGEMATKTVAEFRSISYMAKI